MNARHFLLNLSLGLLLSAALSACESNEEKEIRRLQLEKLRLDTQMQNQRMEEEAERRSQERQAQIAAKQAEERRLEQERLERIAAQQAEQERIRHDNANQFVRQRAEYRLAAIVKPLLGNDPSISVINHDCADANGNFNAVVKVHYKGGISGDSLSFGGKLVRRNDGSEYFQYDQVPTDIIGRLTMIGMPEEKLKLLASGNAFLEWK